MALKSAKAIWDYLEKEYAEDERIRSMQVLNLMREFELQKMKESETVKDYRQIVGYCQQGCWVVILQNC